MAKKDSEPEIRIEENNFPYGFDILHHMDMGNGETGYIVLETKHSEDCTKILRVCNTLKLLESPASDEKNNFFTNPFRLYRKAPTAFRASMKLRNFVRVSAFPILSPSIMILGKIQISPAI
jgi:hypothetical protein